MCNSSMCTYNKSGIGVDFMCKCNENSFKYKGLKFRAEEISKEDYFDTTRDICTGCFFFENSDCDNAYISGLIPRCNAGDREDNRDVVFKLVE